MASLKLGTLGLASLLAITSLAYADTPPAAAAKGSSTPASDVFD